MAPPMTPPSKTDLEELLQAATRGEWETNDPGIVLHPEFGGYVAEPETPNQDADTRLIVAAVNALPALLAERKRLTFAGFSATNLARCEAADGFGHPLDGWTLSDWFTAAMGEFGEAANKAKKLNRIRDGIPGNTESEEELRAGLADEVADAVIYLDLLAQAAGFDLASAVVSKFNRTSEKIGAPHRLLAEQEAADEQR
jgi:NTP pyrophosphatase (non-canonical NTP hydrolase)